MLHFIRCVFGREPRMPQDNMLTLVQEGRCHQCGSNRPSQACSPVCPFGMINAHLQLYQPQPLHQASPVSQDDALSSSEVACSKHRPASWPLTAV